MFCSESSPNLSVCFTEITDWLGGQLTASGTSAIDFGPWNHFLPNLPRSFGSLMNWTSANGTTGCWVSYHCFLPGRLVEGWILPQLARFPNLIYFPRTAVKKTHTADGRITMVECVQRTPRNVSVEWALPLSAMLVDWYSPQDSANFTKTVLLITPKVVVDATEFGDVVVTSGAAFTQGAEYPHELSPAADPTCGLAATQVFFMEVSKSRNANFSKDIPAGSDEGSPFPTSDWSVPAHWNMSWTYRRGLVGPNGSPGMQAVNVGDITQQNWLNDYEGGYLFTPMLSNGPNGNSTPYPVPSAPWAGGVNTSMLSAMEQRAFATFHFLLNTSAVGLRESLKMAKQTSGTLHGLSKMPYLRDSRRPFGHGHFRFTYAAQDFYNSSYPYTGQQFDDVVALGDYIYADMHKLTSCGLPPYQWRNESRPYYIPFRALTVEGLGNFLVAGKTMSQTFHANPATRLHPSEWSSGVAAGVAAAVMVEYKWSSSNLSVAVLQRRLIEIGQPLSWTPPGALPPLPTGFACALGRCVGVTSRNNVSNTSTCDAKCPSLGPNEWLALVDQWVVNGSTIEARFPCQLTKSTAQALVLPPPEKLSVSGGSQCTLISGEVLEQHYLCSR